MRNKRLVPCLPFVLGVVAVTAPAQVTIFSENFEAGGLGVYTETDIAGTPAATLWHGEDECSAGVPLPAAFGTNAAAYNQGDIGLFTYNTGGPNTGALQGPSLASGGASVQISFDYVKDTEGGGIATFDQCYVEARPTGSCGFGGAVQIVGNSPCAAPTTVSALALTSTGGGSFEHRFRFDTVDGVSNDYAGWYVDNVTLQTTGGGAGSTFLSLLSENFEGAGLGAFVETDPAGAPAATLWHGEGFCDVGVPIPACQGTKAAAYNQGDIGTYNFDTGAANTGAIESPAVAVPAAVTSLRLNFDYAKETEASLAFDQCFVEVLPTGGAGWTTVVQLPAANVLCTSGSAFSIGPGDAVLDTVRTAGSGKVRYRFNSVDGVANTGHGWYVDNVKLDGAAPGGTSPFGAGCAGTGGVVPTIGATGLPQLGNLGFAVNLSGALGGTPAVLVFGFSDTTWLAFTLPLNLAFVSAPACFLNVSVDIQFPNATSPGGTASQTLPVPNIPALAGAMVFTQWGVIDPGAAGPFPLAMSPGLKITLF